MADISTSSPSATLHTHAAFLLSQLGSHAARRFAQLLAPLGLEPKHFGVLNHLAASDGRTQQQLADTMGLHRNIMVGLIDELEDKGLVQRKRHPNDRRAHAVVLTDTAHELLPPAHRAVDELDEEFLAALEGDDQGQLITLLQRLVDHTGLPHDIHIGLRH